LDLNPEDTTALISRAATYFDAGEHDKALEDLDRIIRLNPRSIKALGNRAYILEQLGRYDEAIRDLNDILEQDANQLMAMKHLGFIYRQNGDFPNSLRWYRMALKLEGSDDRRKRLQEEITELERKAAQK